MYDPMYQPTPDSAHYAQFMQMRSEYEKRVSEYENESLETAEEEEHQTSERPAAAAAGPAATATDDDEEDDPLDSFMLGIQVLILHIQTYSLCLSLIFLVWNLNESYLLVKNHKYFLG